MSGLARAQQSLEAARARRLAEGSPPGPHIRGPRHPRGRYAPPGRVPTPTTPSRGGGGNWRVYRYGEYRALKAQQEQQGQQSQPAQQTSKPLPPLPSASKPQYTTPKGKGKAPAVASPAQEQKTPSSGRSWAKKMGEITSEKAAKYLKRKKSSSSLTLVKNDHQIPLGWRLLERSSSEDSGPLPEVLHKPSMEVISRQAYLEKKRIAREAKLQANEEPDSDTEYEPEPEPLWKTHPEKYRQPEQRFAAPSEAVDLGIGPSAAPSATKEDEYSDYSWSDVEDDESPELFPSKRDERQSKPASFSRKKGYPDLMGNKSFTDRSKHHGIDNRDTPRKTTPPSIPKRHTARNVQPTRVQKRTSRRLSSLTPSSPPTPSQIRSTGDPFLDDLLLDASRASFQALYAKKLMLDGHPQIPHRSSKRLASPPITRPLPNNMAANSSSVESQGGISGTPSRSDTPIPGEIAPKETKFSYITPRNAGMMSKIPRASPLTIVQATAGTETPESSTKSPASLNRRSSIPLPKRLIQTRAKTPDADTDKTSPAIREDKSGEEVHIKREEDQYDDDWTSEEAQICEAKEVSIVKVEGNGIKRHDDTGETSDLEPGYRVKRLSVTGHGPTLRISASADKLIMGPELEKDKTPMEKPKAKDERRRSWNPKEFASKEGSLAKLSIKSGFSPRPASSLGTPPQKDKSVDEQGTRLKKAQSAMHISPTSSRPSPVIEAQKAEIRKVSNNPLFKSGQTANQSSSLREGLDESARGSRKSTPTSIKGGSTQPPLPRLSSRRDRTPMSISSKDIKNEDSPSAGRVLRSSGNGKRVATPRKITPSKSTPASSQVSNATPEYPSRDSSRKPAPDHTLNAKSKLAHVKNVSSVSNASARNRQGAFERVEPIEFGMSREPTPMIQRESAALDSLRTRSSTPKNSLSRGMLSNLKGFFGKPKHGGLSESSTSMSLRPRFSATTKSKASKENNATTGTFNRALPQSSTLSRFGRGNRATPVSIQQISFPQSQAPGNGDVNALARDILDAAQRETDGANKLRLIRLGKVLVEAINHSNDAERSMLQAMEAARQAEVYAAMTKQNVMQIGLAVQELRSRTTQSEGTYDPYNVI
ncbi:hypothetical protein FQN54_001196 [Arachnomyces sp. PD_36]|nr:hypothetical protein FQN54_001196 [Arachnomyces sp. PD_36]